MAYRPSILCAEVFRSIPAPVARPIRKHTKPKEARVAPAFLVKHRTPLLLVSNQPRSQPGTQLTHQPIQRGKLTTICRTLAEAWVMATSQEAGMGGVCDVI